MVYFDPYTEPPNLLAETVTFQLFKNMCRGKDNSLSRAWTASSCSDERGKCHSGRSAHVNWSRESMGAHVTRTRSENGTGSLAFSGSPYCTVNTIDCVAASALTEPTTRAS